MTIVIKLFNQRTETTEFLSVDKVIKLMESVGVQMSIIYTDGHDSFELSDKGITKPEVIE